MIDARKLASYAVAGIMLAVMAVASTSAVLPARVQRAEDAVAFIVWGLEERSKASAFSNKWAFHDSFGAELTFEIKQIGQCQYQVDVVKRPAPGGDLFRVEYTLDFSVVTHYDAWLANSTAGLVMIKIEGVKWYSKRLINLETGRAVQLVTHGNVDVNLAAGGSVERLQSAYADFRTSHCGSKVQPRTDVPGNWMRETGVRM